ncbi:MAG TPA: hypothetical protein VFB60_11795 [Ktedonobacteraceae bacterium]|nr:hypothetical protein [Ktedonobacteraceae bacterium]
MTNEVIELSSSDLQVIVNALQQSAQRWEKEKQPSLARRASSLARNINETFQTPFLNGSIFQLRWERRWRTPSG